MIDTRQRETKNLDALRAAQRHVDDAASQRMAEAAQLLTLADDLQQRIERLGPKR